MTNKTTEPKFKSITIDSDALMGFIKEQGGDAPYHNILITLDGHKDDTKILCDALLSIGFDWYGNDNFTTTVNREHLIIDEDNDMYQLSLANNAHQAITNSITKKIPHLDIYDLPKDIFTVELLDNPTEPAVEPLTITQASVNCKALREVLDALQDTIESLRAKGVVVEGSLQYLGNAVISYQHPKLNF